ncbi:MAG: sugar-binding domain-containing protein [Thermoguttaceae bacterium]
MMRIRSVGIFVAWAFWAVANATAAEIPRSEHPRPDFRRDQWINLNGVWQFAFDPGDRGLQEEWYAGEHAFERRINVPFCWQSKLSGITDMTGQKIGWYRRTLTLPADWSGRQVWLRFGAVDFEARVWVNGREAGSHEGGYTPFALDITEWAKPGKEFAIVVRAMDATDKELPLGKQAPGWYTPTSGIWQTVWLEARPATRVDRLRLTPTRRGRRWLLNVEFDVAGPDGQATLQIASPNPNVRKTTSKLTLKQGRASGAADVEVQLPRLWTPEDPHLYDLDIHLKTPDGTTDVVHTYFGLRTVGRGKVAGLPHESVLLNGRPIYLRGVLDQSFNPEGIYTAPSDEFIRRDIEIAKRAGFNFLRIHVKSEEPRKLYWADRLGLLVMEDMPCTFVQSARARQAWERTMRATIQRDRNHPSVIAWCLFNEGWGLDRAQLDGGYRSDRDTQQWVARMWQEVKQNLDPSRLVEDHSTDRSGHVKTDLNSWHFSIDDPARARNRIAEVAKNTYAGSSANYVPGKVQDSAPLINSQFGAVGSRGGDRDISWGLRHLITLLRRHERIQGYVYTQLSDVEWEHNGIVNFDRTQKEFGYDAFVPDMTPADLQGADFVGFDTPPTIEALLGEQITVPVFVSHFSQRRKPLLLQWQVTGTDSLGRPVATDMRSRRVTWQPYRVTFQEPLRIHLPEGQPLVGALTLELIDDDGNRVAANFVNLIVRRPPLELLPGEQLQRIEQSPRIEVLLPRLVAVRFDPGHFASFRADEFGWDWLDDRGKFYAHGSCEVEYHLVLPKFIRDAMPAQVVLMAEMATKADRERLDWPQVRRPLDYPQTQPSKHVGGASVYLMDRELWQFELPDDPADSRGVLSHQARYHHGSYGYLVRRKADLTHNVALREAMIGDPILKLRVQTTSDGSGLSIYGQRLGRYPIDPTLIIQTAADLRHPPGWTSTESITTNRLLDRSRLVQGIRTAEDGPQTWRCVTEQPPEDWADPAFDDSSWPTARRPLPMSRPEAPWTAPEIWLRAEVQLPSHPIGPAMRYLHEQDITIWVNGKLLLKASGKSRTYRQRPLGKADMELFSEGRNVVAVHCRQPQGGSGVDVGIRWIETTEDE